MNHIKPYIFPGLVILVIAVLISLFAAKSKKLGDSPVVIETPQVQVSDVPATTTAESTTQAETDEKAAETSE